MEATISISEQRNKRKARMGAIFFSIALVVLLLIPIFWYQNPPPGQEGILVNLGIPDVGDGSENAPEPTSQVPNETEEITPPTEVEEEPEEVVEEEVKPEPTPPSVSKPKVNKEVINTEDPTAVKLRQQKEKERQEKIEADRRDRERAEAEAKAKAEAARKKAEAEAKAKAEAERKAKYDAIKNKYTGAFGGAEGEGKGKTGKPGNQGDPNGDPNADKLTGISTGSGKVGGGLGSRGVVAAPKPRDTSQKTGTVVLKICVDASGKVVGTPENTQRGSTTSDSQLIRIAKKNAVRWKFSAGSIDKQCGTITYEFKVR